MTTHMQAMRTVWTSEMVHEEILNRLENGSVHAGTMQEQIAGMGASRDLVASTVAQAVDQGDVDVIFDKSMMFLHLPS